MTSALATELGRSVKVQVQQLFPAEAFDWVLDSGVSTVVADGTLLQQALVLALRCLIEGQSAERAA